MGMFDSVIVPCPECSDAVEFQSKADECSMAEYNVGNAPLKIIADLDGETHSCENCGREITLRATCHPRLMAE